MHIIKSISQHFESIFVQHLAVSKQKMSHLITKKGQELKEKEYKYKLYFAFIFLSLLQIKIAYFFLQKRISRINPFITFSIN